MGKKKLEFDRKSLASNAVYVVIILATVIFSLFNVGFDLSKLGDGKFWGDVFVNYALAIIIIVASQFDSENKAKEKADYISAKDEFIDVVQIMGKRKLLTVFRFYTKYKYKKLREEYIDSLLWRCGLDIKYLTYSNEIIKQLFNENKLTKEQCFMINKIKSGKYKFIENTSEEILSDFDKKVTYQKMSTQRNEIRTSSLGPKLVMIFASSAFIAATIFNNDSDTAKMAASLIGRLLNIITALFAGFATGSQLADESIRIYKLKKRFCIEFLGDFDSGAYAPSQEEMTDEVIEKIKSYVILPPVIEEEVTIDVAEYEEFKKYKEGKAHDKGKQEP